MRVRIRGPNGQSTVTLPETATIADLRSQISKATALAHFELKYGYPPKPFSLDQYPSTSLPLSSLEVKLDGEQLIVSDKSPPAAEIAPERSAPVTAGQPASSGPSQSAKAAPSAAPLTLSRKEAPKDTPEVPLPTHMATMVLRVMPDDNSCMFRALSSAVLGGELDSIHELRSVIAQVIQSDPDTYNAAVLDKPPDAYCRWIQNENAWGGGIELSILANHFDIEICSIDVQTLRVDRFNEGKPTRVILVYSGIHYDVVALSPSDPPYEKAYMPPEVDVKVFNSEEEIVLQAAVELCAELQKQHYFTDTAAFNIKCNICGGTFKGEKGAVKHAESTGHTDFGEA